MKKIGPVAVIIVLILVIAFGVGQFFALPVQSPAVPSSPGANTSTLALRTQVITYMPATPASSTPVQEGSCWTSSIAAPFRRDAWRCAVGNSISDPCFQIPGGTNLLCGANPAVPDATSSFVLKLTKSLPAPDNIQGSVPANWAWLIKLADGTVCSPFTGTFPIAEGGVSASYGCAPRIPGGEGVLIFNDLNASTSKWTAEVGTLSTVTSGLPTVVGETTVPVDKVWQ